MESRAEKNGCFLSNSDPFVYAQRHILKHTDTQTHCSSLLTHSLPPPSHFLSYALSHPITVCHTATGHSARASARPSNPKRSVCRVGACAAAHSPFVWLLPSLSLNMRPFPNLPPYTISPSFSRPHPPLRSSYTLLCPPSPSLPFSLFLPQISGVLPELHINS